MLKKTIPYTDYNGVERVEDFYFNLSKAESMEMELAAQDVPTIIATFKQIILKAYGEKSPDGRRFVKSEELSKAFSETEAYSILYMELATDANAAAEFVNGIVPKDADAPAAQQPEKPALAPVTN